MASSLTVSMLVRYLGRESYGLCATVTAMASWLSIAQGGIGQSLKNDLIRDPQSASETFSGAFAFVLLLVMAAGTVLTLIVGLLPWKNLVPLMVMSLWVALLTALFGLVRVAWSARQLEFKLAPAMLAGIFVSFGLVVTGIHRGWSAAAVVSASLSGNLIGLVFGLIGMPVRFSKPLRLYRAGLWFFIVEACTILIFETDIVLVNFLLGSGQAAVFALHAQLFVYIETGIFLLVSPYWSAFGEAWQRGERAWLRTGLRRLTGATGLLGSIGVITLIAFGRPLMERWSHGQIAWNPLLALLMGTNVVVQGMTGVYATALGALGIARDPARIIVLQAILNLGVCIWAIRRFGVIGAALGSLATYAVTSGIYLPWKVRQVTA